MSSAEAHARAKNMDVRLRRAVPWFRASGPERAPQSELTGFAANLSLFKRAWPYVFRYIAGRWVGYGRGANPSNADEGGFLFMPLLVTALSVISFYTAPVIHMPAGAAAHHGHGHAAGDAASFWAFTGHAFGAALALFAWLTWLTRGRLQVWLGAAGAAAGLVAASLICTAEPDLGGKSLGIALLVAYVAGAVLRFRLRGGLAMWLRVESYLVYYFVGLSVATLVITTINVAFLTDISTQSVLNGKPLQGGLAALYGHPEWSTGANLDEAARRAIRIPYALEYFIGTLLSLPTLIIGLPYYYTWIHQKIIQNLRLDLMERWYRLSPRYHTSHRVGDTIYRIYLDSAQISNIISRVQMSVFYGSTWIQACFFAVCFDWRIAALVMGQAIPLTAWATWYTRPLRRRALASREATSDLTSRAQEILTGARVVKAYGQEDREQARFENDSVVAFDAALRARFLFTLTGVVAFTIGAAFMLPMIYIMAMSVNEARATQAAGLIALVGLSFSVWNVGAYTWASRRFGQAAVDLRDLSTEWAASQDNTAGLTRVFDILDIQPDVTDAPDARPFGGLSREIRFENVSFAYEDERPVLEDVSFTVRTGSVTAIVGPTGSGKSTLMAMLLRLFDPDRGRILVDGCDLREFTITSLRENIAIAPQEPVLFATSVADNVRYAAPEATQEALEAALAVSCADDFVDELPQGWNTVLAEKGGGLLPGQKQRLCIARAIVKQAPILILDEPTAALDAETEHRLMDNLSRWAKGRAVFIVTHRLSTIRRADHILFIDDGRVVEAGAHAALMADGSGRYRAMVNAERSLVGAEAEV